MRWPNIFFRARKPREEAPRPTKEVGAARISSSVSPTTVIKPASTVLPSATPSQTDIPEGEPGSLSPLPTSTNGKRKTKLTDLARMVPATQPDGPALPPEPSSAVSPPAFTVEVPIGSVTQPENPLKAPDSSPDKPPGPIEAKSPEAGPIVDPSAKASAESPRTESEPEKKSDTSASEKLPQTPPVSGPAPIPPVEGSATPAQPKSEPVPTPAAFEHLPAKLTEKKEFLLVNGERILGTVLSETPENIYLQHGTLGVLTLPRSQIATRPVEIILINGDRIVGDIMAETPESLYVRHASLGMLTVPRSQRSTRVVEALLKDGDRILGEVLAETESSTIIRSSTLGTVTVPHGKVAMLNRKVEQVALKSLPPVALEDKPST